MNQTRNHIASQFSWRATALALSLALLAGCGSSSETATPSDAQSASSMQTAPASATQSGQGDSEQDVDSGKDTATESKSSERQNDAQSSDPLDSSASKVALDDPQVTQAQNLVQDVQSALSSAQLESAAPQATEDAAGDQASVSPDLSAKTQEDIQKVATGAAADDFMATAFEYSQNGWSVEGEPTFVGEPRVASTTFNGAEAKKVEVCVDSSKVSVKDQAGNSMISSTAPKRSRTIYTLVQSDNTWKIASMDFPDNPDC